MELKYGTRFLHGAVKRLGIALEGRRWVERSMTPFSDMTKRNMGTATLSGSFSLGAIDLDLEALVGGGLWRDRGRSLNEVTDMPYRQTEDWLRLMDYFMARRRGRNPDLPFLFSQGPVPPGGRPLAPCPAQDGHGRTEPGDRTDHPRIRLLTT